MRKNFIRKKEDFECLNCGQKIKGSGYTNHCPTCLYSKHVDLVPGDRKNTCSGLMKPVGVEKKGEEYIILHRCMECGAEKKNRAAKDDNFDILIRISKNS
ncbi:MAG: RNHCP domain-containing protein [Candidatus Berkelbacteria bacterium]|nr:RNHCP domain-containing protein [Candidatus Berkelbacteria bacterium]